MTAVAVLAWGMAVAALAYAHGRRLPRKFRPLHLVIQGGVLQEAELQRRIRLQLKEVTERNGWALKF